MFAWDEARRRAKLRKHGIDFADAEKIFRGLTFTVEDDRESYGNSDSLPWVCWRIRWCQ